MIDPRRLEAVQTAVGRFYNAPFRWGSADCVRLAASSLRVLGYDPGLARGGHYESEFGAARALRRAGFRETHDWMDDVVGSDRRISCAEVQPGDIVGFKQGRDMTALSVAVPGGKVLGFYGGEKCVIIKPRLEVAGVTYLAWRCDPIS